MMNQDNVIESFKTVINELESGIAENNERCTQFAQQGNYAEVTQLAESGQKLKQFQQKVDQLRQEWLVYLGKIDPPPPHSGLLVRFPNGKVINQSTSADTFALAIQEIGLEKVRLLNKKVSKVPLISMSAALARALAAQAAAVVQTTAFRRRALQVAV